MDTLIHTSQLAAEHALNLLVHEIRLTFISLVAWF